MVVSDDKKALPGANILLTGTNLGTVSNEDGEFILNISSNELIDIEGKLVVSYIGYITQEINIIDTIIKGEWICIVIE